MITDIEEAVAAVVTDALAADATLTGVPYEVRASTTRAEVPGNASVVAVRVQQGDRRMVALVDVIAEIFVATPSHNEDTSLANHRKVEQAVERVFSPGTTIGDAEEEQTIGEALIEQIESRLDGYSGGGFFNEGWQPGREDTMWMPSLRVKIGVVRD